MCSAFDDVSVPLASAGEGSDAVDPMPGESILLVDDDAALRQLIGDFLCGYGYAVQQADSVAAMRRALADTPVDLIILDIMMPQEDGLSGLQSLDAGSGPSVILLSTLATDIDRIVGLEMGADDYVTKPCNPRELLARIRSVMRRRTASARLDDVPTAPNRIRRFDGWCLEIDNWVLMAPDGNPVSLTTTEFRILQALVEANRKILSRERLIETVYGDDCDSFDRAVDVHISRLRRKLTDRGGEGLLRTVRGEGYGFSANVTVG